VTAYDNQSKLTAKIFSRYFKGATLCTRNTDKDDTHCIGRTEKDDSGTVSVTNKDYKYTNYARNSEYIATSAFDDTQFFLMNNMLIIIDENSWNGNQLVTIDINGKSAKPNAAGHDLFTFELRPTEKSGGYELIPSGEKDTYFYNKNIYCSRTSTNDRNGIACAYYAMQDENYFNNLP